ncbi:hypothetical protein G9A89_017669 [Geosiphon pyriformis]|nr:hypothetical protein G9A89_017669 [Geosiphon pyriformis]
MSCKTILAAEIAQGYRDEVKNIIASRGFRPTLVGFLANKDPAAVKYAEWTAKSCSDIGINFKLRKCDREELEGRIMEANEDKDVDGMMIYYPVYGDRQNPMD